MSDRKKRYEVQPDEKWPDWVFTEKEEPGAWHPIYEIPVWMIRGLENARWEEKRYEDLISDYLVTSGQNEEGLV